MLDWRKNAENPKKIKIKPQKSGPKIMGKRGTTWEQGNLTKCIREKEKSFWHLHFL